MRWSPLSREPQGVGRSKVSRKMRLSLEPMESRLLLSAGVMVATHEYEDGTRITLYDADPTDGVTVPDVAWDRPEYVAGVTDVYVVPGPVDDTVSGIYLLGNGADTDDIGIVVENNDLLQIFRDNRTAAAGPIAYLASEGGLGTAVFMRGLAGANLNGVVFEGGWTLPADLDNDGDTTDLTGLLVGDDTYAIYYVGGTPADTVIDGDLYYLASSGNVAGDLRIDGSLAIANIVNVRGVAVGGDVSIPGGVTSFTANGAVTGDMTIGGGNLIHILGVTTGDLTVTDDIRAIVFKADVISTIKIDGDVIFFWLYNGRLIDGDGDPNTWALDVTGDMNCFKAWGHGGSDPCVQGNVHVGGDIPNSFIVFGDMSGRVVVDGSAAAIYVFGGRLLDGDSDPLTPIFDIGQNVDLIKIFGYTGPDTDVIQGDIDVDGHLQTFYVDGGNFNGTLEGGSIATALYNTPGGVTNPVVTTGGNGTNGGLNLLRSFRGLISGDVSTFGNIGRIWGDEGISSTIDCGGWLRSIFSFGSVTGDVNVAGSGLNQIAVNNPTGNALDGANFNVPNGGLGTVSTIGDVVDTNFNAGGGIQEALINGNFTNSLFEGATPNGAVVLGEINEVIEECRLIDSVNFKLLMMPGRSGFPTLGIEGGGITLTELGQSIFGNGWLSNFFTASLPSLSWLDWF